MLPTIARALQPARHTSPPARAGSEPHVLRILTPSRLSSEGEAAAPAEEFATMPETTSAPAALRGLEPQSLFVQKPWGSELVWAENDLYVGKILQIDAGKRLSLQYHDSKLESQCLLAGRAQ